jgi:predicted nucleic acid-binding protein
MPIDDGSVVLLDSNVWLYAFIIDPQNEKKRASARALFSRYEIVITPQVLNEVSFNMLRRGGASEVQVNWIIRMMLKSNVFLPYSKETPLKASELRQRHSFSFWDSLIVASAIEGRCKAVLSEDMQHGFQVNDLRIVNPFL